MPPISFVVDRREAGKTLAAVLKKRFGISWSQAKRLVEGRHVRVGQQLEAEVARRMKPGKRVVIDAGTMELKSPERGKKAEPPVAAKPVPIKKPVKRAPKAIPPKGISPFASAVEIVYSDDAVVVVNKPAGLTTMRHKEEAEEFGKGKKFLPITLAELLPGLLNKPDRAVLAVHRIDRDTSGLVVFARTPAASESLMKQFRKHTVDRLYIGLTRGVPLVPSIDTILVPNRGDGRRGSTRKTNPPDGKRAVTHVKVLEQLGAYGVVECRLETGRTHQVRIHLGECGAPLCGETIYDRPINGRPAPDGSDAERPMLHAARIGFAHPETGRAMKWEVKPPEDFAKLWAELRKRS